MFQKVTISTGIFTYRHPYIRPLSNKFLKLPLFNVRSLIFFGNYSQNHLHYAEKFSKVKIVLCTICIAAKWNKHTKKFWDGVFLSLASSFKHIFPLVSSVKDCWDIWLQSLFIKGFLNKKLNEFLKIIIWYHK